MCNGFRDFFRRRRVERHVAVHGPHFVYHGLDVTLPDAAGLSARNALLRGKYERGEAEMILKHMPGDLPVIELGGSLGVVSRLIRSRLQPGVRHVVVEANADLISLCAGNAMARDDAGGTEVIHAALYHDGPVARFRVGADIHSSALDAGGAGGRVVEVPATTLATLVGRLGSPADYVLVSDIEGAEFGLFEREPTVLRGAKMVIVEIHPDEYRRSGKSEADFLALAAAAGLRVTDRVADVLVLERAAQKR